MMRAGSQRPALSTDDTTMIGTRWRRYFSGGRSTGIATCWCQRGDQARIGRYAYSPELVVDSIGGFTIDSGARSWEPWWSLRIPLGERIGGLVFPKFPGWHAKGNVGAAYGTDSLLGCIRAIISEIFPSANAVLTWSISSRKPGFYVPVSAQATDVLRV